MKTRILSALVAIAILFTCSLGPATLFRFAVFIVGLIGILEFYRTMKVSSGIFMFISFATSIPIMFFYNDIYVIGYSIFLMVLFSFMLVILDTEKRNVNDIYITIISTIFISFLLSHLIKVRDLNYGNLLIWFIFIIAWITDTFAYFIGIKFGKHKLTPISPKKSVEGSVGGFVACIVVVAIYGYYVNTNYNVGIPYYAYIVLAAVGSVISQIGDLAASLLKRSAQVKDFGGIMPGHGGAIDRFDSILFVAPIVYYFFSMYIK